MPNIYANHLKQAGAAGHATVLDLVEQVTAAEGRDRAERVLHAILGQLPPDQATAFLGGAMPPRRPLGVRDADLPRDDHRPLFARASAAADTEAARPVQLAQADTGTMTDAAPASAPQVQPPASPQPQAAKPVPSAGGVPTQGSKPVPNQMAQGQGGLARTQANAGTGTPPRDYGAIGPRMPADRIQPHPGIANLPVDPPQPCDTRHQQQGGGEQGKGAQARAFHVASLPRSGHSLPSNCGLSSCGSYRAFTSAMGLRYCPFPLDGWGGMSSKCWKNRPTSEYSPSRSRSTPKEKDERNSAVSSEM